MSPSKGTDGELLAPFAFVPFALVVLPLVPGPPILNCALAVIEITVVIVMSMSNVLRLFNVDLFNHHFCTEYFICSTF